MNINKRKKLESKGWKVGSADEFLALSREESEYIEFKLALSDKLAQMRKQKNITQTELARKIESSQSRVAKMEKGDPSVSLDLIFRSLFALGTKRSDLNKMFTLSS